ncbi:hypothetical protein ACJJTC_017042 [Scirpophaga incertulas]
MFIVHFTISLTMLRPVTEGSAAPSKLLASRIGPCAGADFNGSVVLSEMSLRTRFDSSTASGWLNVSKDIPNEWTIKGTMQKCQDIRNLDTCDYFKSFPLVRAGCHLTEQPDEADLYNLFFQHTQPRISCPIKAGRYKVQAFPFLMDDKFLAVSESKISTSLFGYTYRLEGFQKKEKLFCVEASLRLLYIREGGTERPVPPLQDVETVAVDLSDGGDPDDLTDVY